MSQINTNTNQFTSATLVDYDDAGNVTRDGKFRGLSYRYDANNRMTEARWDDQLGVSTSVYDALGQRVRTTISGEWHHYVYDAQGRVIAEYGPGGAESAGRAGARANLPRWWADCDGGSGGGMPAHGCPVCAGVLLGGAGQAAQLRRVESVGRADRLDDRAGAG